MKPLHLLTLSAVTAALALLAADAAGAQQRPVGGGPRITFPPPTFPSAKFADGAWRSAPPSHSNHFSWEGKHGFHGGFFVIEREVPIIIEREAPPPPAAVPLPEQAQGGPKVPPRKPYVIGRTYASLPGGCMKLIEDGVSYYFCGGGEWYRQVGEGRSVTYKAVAKP